MSDIYENENYSGTPVSKNDSILFAYGSINPNNPNEVVYQGGKAPEWYLYTYNLITKQRYKLTELLPTHNAKWHKSGWITFAGEDNNIYIVKSNGDSLIKLTVTGDCFYPEWNSSGTQIICQKAFTSTLERNYLINVNGTGVEKLTLNDGGIGVPCSWSPSDSFIAFSYLKDIELFDYYNNQKTILQVQRQVKSTIMGMCWMPGGKKLLWCPDGQPEVLDIAAGSTQKIIPLCEKNQYSHPSITADGRYALFNLNIGGYVAYNTTQTKRRLSVIDLTTNTETILDLPE